MDMAHFLCSLAMFISLTMGEPEGSVWSCCVGLAQARSRGGLDGPVRC